MTASFPEPDHITAPERYVAALSKQFTMENRHEIPALWGQLWTHDFKLEGLNMAEAYGVSYDLTSEGTFQYGAGY